MDKHIIYRAGAGAGKTTGLVKHVFQVADEFYAKNKRWPQIVVTTFTRKATQELRERLILHACKEKKPEWIDFASSSSKLFITTIHGVLSQFLRRYGHLVGLDNSFTLVTNGQSEFIGKKILKDLIAEEQDNFNLIEEYGYQKLFLLCNEYYEASLQDKNLTFYTAEDFKKIVSKELAGHVHLLQVHAQEILELTDNEKWVAFAKGLQGVVARVEAGEFDVEALAGDISALGSKPRRSKSVAIDGDFDKGFKSCLDAFKKFLNAKENRASSWQKFESVCCLFQPLAEKFSKKLIAVKKISGQYEIRDLELFAAMVMAEKPEVAEAFSEQWDYWLIDEYQDTSPLQVNLLKNLIGDRYTYTVGDPQQSIYLFRGADVSVFAKRELAVAEGGGLATEKMQNWRSRPELLEFFNYCFDKISNEFKPMQPRSQPDDIKNPVARVAIVDSDQDADQEFKAIASQIVDLVHKGVKFDEICVLARTNQYLSQVSLFLQKYNIPTHVHASGEFYFRREVLDFLFFLKFLINPHDNLNFIGLIKSPWFYVGEEYVLSKVDVFEKASYWQQLKVYEHAVVEKLKASLLLKTQLGLLETSKSVLFDHGYLDFSQHYDNTGRREANVWKLITQIDSELLKPGFNLLDFINNSLVEFDEEGSAETDAVAAVEPNRVNLMTIHSSKGLEFNHVIIPRLHKKPNLSTHADFTYNHEEHKFSLRVADSDENKMMGSVAEKVFMQQMKILELKEADRVLYVAMTRAKQSLFLSWDKKVEKDSPAMRLSIDLTVGEVSKDKFTYSVVADEWSPVALDIDAGEASSVREPLAGKSGENTMTKHSVSSLLGAVGGVKKAERQSLPSIMGKVQGGVMLHKCMQILKNNFEFDFNSVVDDWFTDSSDKVLQAIEYVKNLNEPNIQDVLKHGEVEWGFQLLTDKGIREGQIDVWGKDASGTVWVIDYKSGSKKYSDRAFEQLQLYSDAIVALGEPVEKIKLAVIYPFDETVVIR